MTAFAALKCVVSALAALKQINNGHIFGCSLYGIVDGTEEAIGMTFEGFPFIYEWAEFGAAPRTVRQFSVSRYA